MNAAIPGPPDNLLLGASSELYRAGLNDFWGFNPRLFTSLFNRFGKVRESSDESSTAFSAFLSYAAVSATLLNDAEKQF